MSGYHHELYIGLNGLLELREEWESLFRKLEKPSYYQDWRWMHAVAKWLVKDNIFFVVLRKAGELVLILPLQADSRTKGGIKHDILCLPAHNHIVLSDVLVDPDLVRSSDLMSVLSFLSGQKHLFWSFLEFKAFSSDSQLNSLFSKANVKLVQKARNAYFQVRDAQFEETLSKKFIKNIKRLENKAAKELGEVTASFNSDPAVLPECLEKFFQTEASGWKGEEGTSSAIKFHPDLVSFYQELYTSFSKDGSFAINLLEIGGEPAAAQFCIRCSNTWYILKIAYEDNLKKYGPGNILMLKFLQSACIDPNVREINLVTAPQWAERWHLEYRPVYTFRYFNKNAKGHLTKAVFHVKHMIRSLKENS